MQRISGLLNHRLPNDFFSPDESICAYGTLINTEPLSEFPERHHDVYDENGV
jgi:hypothetical protein